MNKLLHPNRAIFYNQSAINRNKGGLRIHAKAFTWRYPSKLT